MFSLIDAARRNGTSIADALFAEILSGEPDDTDALTERALAGLPGDERVRILLAVHDSLADAIALYRSQLSP